MNKQIFLNLPVADLPKSTGFFKALGYSLNPQFSGEGCACVVISETISVMLGTHAKFPNTWATENTERRHRVHRGQTSRLISRSSSARP